MSPDLHSSQSPHRRHPVHLPVLTSDNRTTLVFLTVCTKNRAPLLTTPAMHRAILEAWQRANHWLIGRYVILPDHIHLFSAPGGYPPQPLLNWVRFWKAQIAKTSGYGSDALWQKNFWDTQLRRGESYAAKWEYVRGNPVRHRLVARPEQWPYQGELNCLPWHD